jgi:hypothetical protein
MRSFIELAQLAFWPPPVGPPTKAQHICQLSFDRLNSLLSIISKIRRGIPDEGPTATILPEVIESREPFGVSTVQGGDSVEEHMAHVETRAWRAGIASQSSTDAGRESDDGFDYPPTTYPGRELFTASLFVLLIIALAIWGGWKLTSLVVSLV